jgi:hypothetical protein
MKTQNLKKMKTQIRIMAILLIIGLTACEKDNINPSSNITIQDRTIEVYTGIEIGSIFQADITYSADVNKIEIEANENLHAYIDVIKQGNNLVIKLKDNTDIQGQATLKAHITTTNPIGYIAVHDASSLTMLNAQSIGAIELSVSDASILSGKLDADISTVYIDDASSIYLEGTSNQITVNAKDASELSGLDLIVKDAVCRLSEASKASLTVTETIDLEASDASVFRYKGDAVITNIDLTEASQIIKLN